MINPTTQTTPQINPFSFSDIKDAVRNVLGESINNLPTGRYVGQQMKNPYNMNTPQKYSESSLYESLSQMDTTYDNSSDRNKIYPDFLNLPRYNESQVDTTYGISMEDKILPYDEQNIETLSLSSIFPTQSNDQTLTPKLNETFGVSPEDVVFEESKQEETPQGLTKLQLRKKEEYEARKQRKKEAPYVPIDLSKRTKDQLIQQAIDLGISVTKPKQKGRGAKRDKTKEELIKDINEKLKTSKNTTSTNEEIIDYVEV
jgi:hypothetical protein